MNKIVDHKGKPYHRIRETIKDVLKDIPPSSCLDVTDPSNPTLVITERAIRSARFRTRRLRKSAIVHLIFPRWSLRVWLQSLSCEHLWKVHSDDNYHLIGAPHFFCVAQCLSCGKCSFIPQSAFSETDLDLWHRCLAANTASGLHFTQTFTVG